MWKVTPEGINLPIKVVPKCNRTEIVAWENGELKIRLAAIPEKGEANQELIRFLAKFFKLPKSSFVITHGETSRHKIVQVATTLDKMLVR